MITNEEDERQSKTYFYSSLQVFNSLFVQAEAMLPQDKNVECNKDSTR